MFCEICKKNQATIHIQEIVNTQKKVLHICAECAAKKTQDDPALKGFNLAEMLYNLSGQLELPFGSLEDPSELDAEDSKVVLVCAICGWDSVKFRRTGRMGCGNCYSVFKEILDTALKNMHRGSLHVGKKPGGGVSNESSLGIMEVMSLQKELDELVQREEYEKAAVVRDKINELKSKVGG